MSESNPLSEEQFQAFTEALSEKYILEEQVGAGGMGIVFQAQDLRHDRKVTVKILLQEIAVSMGPERFLREVRIEAGLNHPHILPVYDSGEAAGLLYCVTPFISGESLAERLKREKQLPCNEALRICREIADALMFAHAHDVIHRDVKPGNILLEAGHAILADFGLARAMSPVGDEGLTQVGFAVGTPSYTSPEQVAADPNLDGRADLYSLGCVLYEMLAGQPPFVGPTSDSVVRQHLTAEATSVRILRPAVPEGVEAILDRLLAKSPADRFTAAEELVRALDSAISGEFPQGRKRQKGGVPRWREYLLPAGISIVLVFVSGLWALDRFAPDGLAIGWLGFSSGDADSGSDEPLPGGLDDNRIAVLYFEDRSPDSTLGHLASGLTEALIDRLTLVRGLDVISPNGVGRYRSREIPRDSIARLLGARFLVEGSLEEVGDRFRVTVRLIDGSNGVEFDSETLERARGDLLALRDSTAEEVARILRGRLGDFVELERLRTGTESAEAWSLLHQGRRAAETLSTILDAEGEEGAARAYEGVDSLFVRAGNLDPAWAEPWVRRAFEAYLRSQWRGGTDPTYADEWIQVGLGHANQALALDTVNAWALEARGKLRYFRWLLNLAVDAEEADSLFARAEADLRASVGQDRTRADAWQILSHLLLNKPGGVTESRLAARRAYEADAYLNNVDRVIERLYSGAYNALDFTETDYWCGEGERRFPEDPKFKQCQLWVMSMEEGTPDPDRAWQLLGEYLELSPPEYHPYRQRAGQIGVASVLARAGLADSARAVVERSLTEPDVDPRRDLWMYGAYVMVQIGDHAEAVRHLTEYIAANPRLGSSLVNNDSWWWRPLQGRADFRALTTMANVER